MAKRPLYFTFGNHMHWVDMQWLWGYEVLPACTADMLELISRTGARGNVNFDAVGYEKMAAEAPEALQALRDAVARGDVEPVGCTYGQPYGHFHGLESNIRQFAHGVRATRRLLGVRPATFWEEEFSFFPQLPQLLTQAGYTGACLFFQWTWHTPELPRERSSLIRWRGVDGSELWALPRNDLNVHQWPEDFEGLLDRAAGLADAQDWSGPPAVVQWLELMPSQDWMCRSELLVPKLTELFSDDRFDVRPRTCAALIRELAAGGHNAPVREYSPDQIWHGMTLGKNADRHPRTSRRVERLILAAESLAATASLLGRPYPSWDVYPAWELDEAWRELLVAQHHDNHECEGLCGFIGYQQMEKAESAAREVFDRTLTLLRRRSGAMLATNPCGFADARVMHRDRPDAEIATIPAFGFADERVTRASEPFDATQSGGRLVLQRGGWRAEVSLEPFGIAMVAGPGRGPVRFDPPLLTLVEADEPVGLPEVETVEVDEGDGEASFEFEPFDARDPAGRLSIDVVLPSDDAGLTVNIWGLDRLPRPDGGLARALRAVVSPAAGVRTILADGPGSVHAVEGTGEVSRKYPTGDWMTTEQRFEHLHGSLTSSSFVDLELDVDAEGERGAAGAAAEKAGVLVLHEASQQWFRRPEGGVECVLNAYDPWDEERYDPDHVLSFRIVPHGGLSHAERRRHALRFARWPGVPALEPVLEPGAARDVQPVGGGGPPEAAPAPAVFGPLEVASGTGVTAEAFWRSNPKEGEHLRDWGGHRMRESSGGACTHPFCVRLVEWNGEAGEVTLKLAGPIASAAKVNLMGEVGEPGDGPRLRDTRWLDPEPCAPPAWWDPAAPNPTAIEWQQLRVPMRAREIATVMADLVPGRKQWRNLDDRREVWATVHRST